MAAEVRITKLVLHALHIKESNDMPSLIWLFRYIGYVKDIFRYGLNNSANFILWSFNLRGAPGRTPGAPFWLIFIKMNFFDVKKYTPRPFWWGGNLLWSPLNVGHWVAQTWPYFTNFVFWWIWMRHGSKFANFCTRALQM